MSDFDDEPVEGVEANEPTADEVPDAPPARAPKQEIADDDWDDDWDDDDTGGGAKRDLTLVYAIVAAAIVIVLAVVLTRPKDDDSSTNAANNGNPAATQPEEIVKNWQGGVGDAVGPDGADAQKRVADAEGIYVWTDFGGWHLRNNGTDAVSVTVTADQVKVKKTDDRDDGDEGDASFSTEATVTLPAGDGAEGIGLDLGNSESAVFTFTIDGQNVPADQIFLGGGDAVAEQNPVTFTKS